MKSVLTALLCLGQLASLAQKNYQKGCVVLNNGDTLSGYIDYQEHEKNPSSIRFTKDLQEQQVYTTGEVRYFEITGLDVYERWPCRISLDCRSLYCLSTGRDTSYKTDTVFLQVLTTGKNVKLFQYTDDIKPRFYTQSTREAAPKELIYSLYLDPEDRQKTVELHTWQNQLTVYADHFGYPLPDFQKLMNWATYDQKSIQKLVNVLNREKKEKSTAFPKYKTFRFFGGAGLNRSTFSLKGPAGLPQSKLNFSDSYAPVFFVGVDAFLNPAIRRFQFREEIAYSVQTHNGTYKEESPYIDRSYHYRLRQKALSLSFSPVYNLYNKETVRLFLGAGIAISYFSYSENRYYNKVNAEQYEGKPFEFNTLGNSMPVRAGVALNNRLEVSLLRVFPLSSFTNYLQIKETVTGTQLRAAYLLSNKKK